nr:Hsp70 family protein [Mycoplasmopsis bovis]
MTIKNSSKLSDAEIEEMIKDAEKNREADAKRAEEISTIIQAENLVNSLEKEMNRRQHCDSWRRKNKNCWVHKGS